jgi:hypothetical protein
LRLQFEDQINCEAEGLALRLPRRYRPPIGLAHGRMQVHWHGRHRRTNAAIIADYRHSMSSFGPGPNGLDTTLCPFEEYVFRNTIGHVTTVE